MGTTHTTRIESALALGGYAVFCSCGTLTGFTSDRLVAEKIARDHIASHELREEGDER